MFRSVSWQNIFGTFGPSVQYTASVYENTILKEMTFHTISTIIIPNSEFRVFHYFDRKSVISFSIVAFDRSIPLLLLLHSIYSISNL